MAHSLGRLELGVKWNYGRQKEVGTSVEAFQSQGLCTLQTKYPMTPTPGDKSRRGTAFSQLDLWMALRAEVQAGYEEFCSGPLLAASGCWQPLVFLGLCTSHHISAFTFRPMMLPLWVQVPFKKAPRQLYLG